MKRKELLKAAKPILFNSEMVEAILGGLKTCTRRIVKPQPGEDKKYVLGVCVCGDKKEVGKVGFGSKEYGERVECVKPNYEKGDILYVRETWSAWGGGYVYKMWPFPYPQPGESKYMRWYPSIHMPKDAARIFLKVTDVRAERLWHITVEEIRKEGLSSMAVHAGDEDIAFKEWRKLWDSTISAADLDRYGWDANPWVWVYEFERIEVE